jgi:hypothetical protein
MNNQLVLLLIALAVLIALVCLIPNQETLGDYVAYQVGPNVNCQKFPDAPECKPPPTPPPINKGIATCAPPNGQWSIPDADQQGRSQLASPCCQPPQYELGKEKAYKTCDDKLNLTNKEEKCVSNCCAFANAQANNYDPSWYPMARCACSLWCYNQTVPHFAKYGTAVHYISGDIAEAHTSDSPDFIGSGGDFSGQ